MNGRTQKNTTEKGLIRPVQSDRKNPARWAGLALMTRGADILQGVVSSPTMDNRIR